MTVPKQALAKTIIAHCFGSGKLHRLLDSRWTLPLKVPWLPDIHPSPAPLKVSVQEGSNPGCPNTTIEGAEGEEQTD